MLAPTPWVPFTRKLRRGRTSKVDELADYWDDWKDHSDVKSVPFQDMIDKARGAAAELDTFQKGIDQWTVNIVVPGKTKRFRELLSCLNECSAEVSEYQAALDVLNQQSTGAVSIRKRREREARNKFCQLLVRKGDNPSCIARAPIVFYTTLVFLNSFFKKWISILIDCQHTTHTSHLSDKPVNSSQ